jgi:hypothetical protein
MNLRLSQQAMGSLLITLQKCLAEEADIMDLLGKWDLYEDNGEIFVKNPPPSFQSNLEFKFDTDID